jgi:hypothetical protein
VDWYASVENIGPVCTQLLPWSDNMYVMSHAVSSLSCSLPKRYALEFHLHRIKILNGQNIEGGCHTWQTAKRGLKQIASSSYSKAQHKAEQPCSLTKSQAALAALVAEEHNTTSKDIVPYVTESSIKQAWVSGLKDPVLPIPSRLFSSLH